MSIWEALRTGAKIPVGRWAKQAVDWLIDKGGFLFDWLSTVLKTMIDGLVWLLELPHPFVFTALVVALALWLKRSVPLAVFVAVSLLFIINQGYWDDMIKTLALIIAAAVVCMSVGVPLGIAAAHNPRFSAFLRPVLDLMQTIPTFVYLIPALILFGLGMVPVTVARRIEDHEIGLSAGVEVADPVLKIQRPGAGDGAQVQQQVARALVPLRGRLPQATRDHLRQLRRHVRRVLGRRHRAVEEHDRGHLPGRGRTGRRRCMFTPATPSSPASAVSTPAGACPMARARAPSSSRGRPRDWPR